MVSETLSAMPADLRRKNLNSILNVICLKKQFTVTEIAEQTKISRQTIAKALEHLISLGIIFPAGKGESTSAGGKKPVRYALNQSNYVICMTQSSHETAFSLMTLAYERIDGYRVRFVPEASTEIFREDSLKAIHTLLDRNHIDPAHFLGTVFCTGGIVDEKNGVIVAALTFNHGRNFAMRDLIESDGSVPGRLCVENVARVCARTMISHENIDQKKIAVFYFDYGMAVTLIENGIIAPTSHNTANEWGHTVVDPWDKETCVCGSNGCLELLISERRIRSQVDALPPKQRLILLEGYDPEDDLRIHVMHKSEQGNPDAARITAYMAEIFGIALNNLYLTVDPDYIILQGAFADCTEEFLELSKARARRNFYLQDIDLDIRCYHKRIRHLQEIGSVNSILRTVVNDSVQDS